MDRRHHVQAAELELLDLEVTRAGGSVRYLAGERYGLRTSIFRSEVPAGSGPAPHSHAYVEIFVLVEGRGRYIVGDDTVEASGGDIVIVPAGVRHSFRNVGTSALRQVAIHEAPSFSESRDTTGDPMTARPIRDTD